MPVLVILCVWRVQALYNILSSHMPFSSCLKATLTLSAHAHISISLNSIELIGKFILSSLT